MKKYQKNCKKNTMNYSNSEKQLNNYHPFLINNMKDVICRIVKAVNSREKIVVFGYYDVDGITSVSSLLLVLKYLNADVEYFIPTELHRVRNLTEEDIKQHIEFLGTKLIISIGGQLNSEKEVTLCKNLNIDMITLCDEKEQSNSYGYIINPMHDECKYPFKNLSCSGVTYKVIQALSIYYKTTIFNKFIDLVCLGTLSSGKKLEDENLYIIEKGIRQIKNTNNYGIKALMKMYHIEELNKDILLSLGSIIRPKINPIGNMDDAKIIVELFTTRNMCKAEQIAKYIYREEKFREQ